MSKGQNLGAFTNLGINQHAVSTDSYAATEANTPLKDNIDIDINIRGTFEASSHIKAIRIENLHPLRK